jgi:hypothetical protein
MAVLLGGEVKFDGGVIMEREENGYHDSDFYVIAWDEDTKSLTKFYYNSTRYGGGGSARVDATPESTAKAAEYAYKYMRKIIWAKFLKDLAVPEKGDTVVIARGKKADKGKTGKVFWIGAERTYGTGYSEWSLTKATKCGVALDDERDEKGRFKNVVWTYTKNLDVDVKAKIKYSKAKRALKNLKFNAINYWAIFNSKYATMFL